MAAKKSEPVEPPKAPVQVQEGALIGDEEIQKHAHVVEPEVVSEETTQKYAPEARQQEVYPVHETSVALDTVVTDPTSPEAVQIPDAGRGDTVLPIHSLTQPTPEQVFAEKASEQGEPDEEENEKRLAEGRSRNYGPDAP